MRKSFTRFFMLVIMIVIVAILSSNKMASASNSSPPAKQTIAVEMNALPVFTDVVSDANWQIQPTIVEGLEVKKCDASSFVIFTRLQTTTFRAQQVVGNKITSMKKIVAVALMRDDRSHILKELINVCGTTNDYTQQLSQVPTVEGLWANEKFSINTTNFARNSITLALMSRNSSTENPKFA